MMYRITYRKSLDIWRTILIQFKNIYYEKRYGVANLSGNCKIGEGLKVIGGQYINLGRNIYVGRYCLLDTKTYYKNGEISIGDYCEIHDFTQIVCYGGNIVIGNYCSLNPFCILRGHGGIKIGDNVRIGPHVDIIAADHGFVERDIPSMFQSETMKGIEIENDVWIGANAVIVDGIKISKGAIIAAGAVVTRNVSEYNVAAGVPAKTIKIRGVF